MRNSITENLERAINTMESALKKYAEGDIEIANMRREEANNLFDEFATSMADENEADKTMYGENINFGKIYNIFEETCEKLFETEEGKKCVGKFVNTIKNNNVLNEQFKVYDALENNTSKCNTEAIVNEVCSTASTFTKKEISEANRLLLKLLREAKVDESPALDATNDLFYESIETILLTPKTVTNAAIIAEAKQNIVKHLSENNEQNSDDINTMSTDMMSELAERHADELNDDEMEFVTIMTDKDTDKEKVFNETKNRLIWKLNEALVSGKGDTNKIKILSEKIKSKNFDEKTAVVDIAEMVEAMNIIGE